MLRIFKNFRKQEVVLALFSVVFVVAQVWLVTLCVWQFIGNGTGSCLCITDCFEFQCNRTWKVI